MITVKNVIWMGIILGGMYLVSSLYEWHLHEIFKGHP